MVEPVAAHARDLGDYVSLGRRRWAWIAVGVVMGIATAFVHLTTAEATYQSAAKVLVESAGSSTAPVGARTNDEVNLDTEAQLVRSEPVAQRVVELLDSPLSAVALAQRVTVTVPPNTTVMSIAFTASSAEEAQRGAAMFAQAYLESRQETQQDEVAAEVARLETQIDQTTQEIQDASVAITKLSGANRNADRAFLVARRTALSNQLASYNAELAPLVGAVGSTGKLIQEAQLPRRPVDPNPFLVLPAGLMAGLVLGLGLAAWRERSDKRIHAGVEVERLFGLDPLCALRAGTQGPSRLDHDVRALYHSLRANGPDRRETLLLVCPDAPETAEHLAYSLSLVAARSGAATAYVTRPQSPVLADRKRAPVERAGTLQLPDYEDLGVMVDGEFHSGDLARELHTLSSDRDFLILGLPHDDPSVDVPILGRHVDVAVVLVRLGVTRRDSVAAVLAELSKSGVDRVVAVTFDPQKRRLRRGRGADAEAFVPPAGQTWPRPLPVEPAAYEQARITDQARKRGGGGPGSPAQSPHRPRRDDVPRSVPARPSR